MQRVTSLESLKLSFWNPAKSMQDVIQSVIKLLSDCGRLGLILFLRSFSFSFSFRGFRFLFFSLSFSDLKKKTHCF